MDLRAPVSSVSLFKETRTDVEPLTPGSVIQIQVPSTSTFTVRRKQRHFLKTLPDYKDENEYVKHCLASSTSLYFGKSKRHPRCFLWRVLQDFKVLELRSVDLSKIGDETREASFSIQLCFSTAIKYGGVALAESADKDILNVFVLTRGNELYTFAVRKGFFCHASASEEDISRWCKAAKPATFSISTPHGLTSASPLQLIVSLSDGRILQLTRGKDEDGSKWHESTYGDGKWASSLRGLVRWQGSNTVKYDGTTLEQGTPTAIAVSPDKKHIFAVCLDHTLRIWNLNNATSVYSKDLLWQRREPHDIPKLMLDPSSRNVLQLFKIDLRIDGIEYYAVTFSPQDFGQFKFWGVRDPDHGEQGVCDLFPDYVLKPPDPDPSPESKAIWKATDFKIIGGQHGKELAMWVLMRSSREYMLYHLKFDLEDLPNVWRDSWSSTAFETLHNSPPPQISDFDPEDVTESWLNHILHNSRYPASVIEMGLKIYCSQRSLSECEAKASLRQRMCSAVASQVRSVYVVNDFNMYRIATYQEWTILWQDIRDLNRLGWEVMSLAIDEHVELPWLAFANGCSAIRTCDDVEIIAQNSPTNLAVSNNLLRAPSIETDYGIEPKLPDELAAIVETAATFRQSFSYILRKTCDTVLATELWLDPSYSVPLRIQSVYDRCNFADEIGPSSFDNLINGLERIGGFDGLETHTFLAILKYFSHDLRNTSSGLIHTMFGLKVIINGAREMIELRERLLFDLLVLIVFIDVEIDREETPMENLDASQIYVEMLDLLKQYQTMQWLVKNTRAAKSDVFGYSVPTIGDDNSSINNAIPQTWTILESIFTFYLTPQSFEAQTQSDALTETIHDLFKFATGGQGTRLAVDDVAVYVQCNLLVKGNIDLASEFLQYQPSTAWATYIRGRFSLLNGDFTEAAIYFKKASYKLC